MIRISMNYNKRTLDRAIEFTAPACRQTQASEISAILSDENKIIGFNDLTTINIHHAQQIKMPFEEFEKIDHLKKGFIFLSQIEILNLLIVN